MYDGIVVVLLDGVDLVNVPCEKIRRSVTLCFRPSLLVP